MPVWKDDKLSRPFREDEAGSGFRALDLTLDRAQAIGVGGRALLRGDQHDGAVALSKCGPATRPRVARENCPQRRLEDAGSGPTDDTTAQHRWGWSRRFGGAWRRTPGSLCLPDRILSLLAKPARSKRLYLWPVRREFYSRGTGGY